MAFSYRTGTNWYHDFPKLARDAGFYFNSRRSKVRVDWNRIGGIDIDRVIQERDFYIIDENINNVVDYNLESQYDVKILDPNFVKLFKLAQLSVEYLLYCKQYLDHSVVILKDELRSKADQNVKLKQELTCADEDLNLLKDKLKDKYKYFEKRYSESQGEVFKCPYCPKTFVSAIFTNSHIGRRHSNSPQLLFASPIHDNSKTEAEKLQDEIKSLKERLNQTERVIRNEAGKLSDSGELREKYKENENDINSTTKGKKDVEKDKDKIEEEHRRYREEISNLSTMLFSEIRNLRDDDKKSSQLDSENDWKELLNQQENEIQRLRDQIKELSTVKSGSDLEIIQSKLSRQDEYWQSKIDQIESQHTKDIEELAYQLKITQETAEKMRNDYVSKLKELQEKSEGDEYSTFKSLKNEKNPISNEDENYGKSKSSKKHFHKESDEDENTLETVPSTTINHRIKVNSADPKHTAHHLHKKYSSKSDSEDSHKQLINEGRRKRWSVNAEVMTDNKRTEYRINKVDNKDELMDKRNLMLENEIKRLQKQLNMSFSQSDSESETETISGSDNSGSDLESQSTEEQECSQDSSGSDQKPESKIQIKNQEELKEELLNILDQKVADLGIDPDIDGISKATYQRLINIVKQHRSVNSRKYKRFEKIRRCIVQKLHQRFINQEKDLARMHVPPTPKKSPLNRLMSNVKSNIKAIKALGTQSPQDHTPKLKKRVDAKHERLELLPKKITQQDLQENHRRETKDDQKTAPAYYNEPYTPSPRRFVVETKSKENDSLKKVHSYKNIKEYLKEGSKGSQGRMSTSTPLKEELMSVLHNRSATSNISSPSRKSNDTYSLPTSPQESRSVLKSAGSSLNLGKKKVLFHLETKEELSVGRDDEKEKDVRDIRPQSRLHDRNISDSEDFDVSSIGDEESRDSRSEDKDEPVNPYQRQKVSEISKVIEEQLNSSHSKAIGIRTKKEFSIYEDDKLEEHDKLVGSFFNSPSNIYSRSSKLPQPAPRTPKVLVSSS